MKRQRKQELENFHHVALKNFCVWSFVDFLAGTAEQTFALICILFEILLRETKFALKLSKHWLKKFPGNKGKKAYSWKTFSLNFFFVGLVLALCVYFINNIEKLQFKFVLKVCSLKYSKRIEILCKTYLRILSYLLPQKLLARSYFDENLIAF